MLWEADMAVKRYVKRPTMINGKWTVVVADSPSPLAKVIEEIPCESRLSADKTYQRTMKELGYGY
jgi:hypothetical protein